MWYDKMLEQDKIPDILLRKQIRKYVRQRLADENKGNVEAQQLHLLELIDFLKSSPIAVNTSDANEQHYEVPTEFYKYCLGKNLKYSCAYWDDGITSLDAAETRMLELSCDTSRIKRWSEYSGIGLWLGFFILVHGCQISKQQDHGSF
jgi:cyclopropane-fatty-acyl-phospholipid synthase